MDSATLAVLVFGAILWGIWWAGQLRFLQALTAALFGFYLAASGIAPAVRAGVTAVFIWISTWHI